MSVQIAGLQVTELRNVLLHHRQNLVTPFWAVAWKSLLSTARLLPKYTSLSSSFILSFDIRTPTMHYTNAPSNSYFLALYNITFNTIIQYKFNHNYYLGPVSHLQVKALIGPFQSSPLSLIPKPYKPDAYWLIQNYSYSHNALPNYRFINSYIDSSNYSYTWGTFAAFFQLVLHLPPGSQGAIRDISEAYQNVPVHPSQ